MEQIEWIGASVKDYYIFAILFIKYVIFIGEAFDFFLADEINFQKIEIKLKSFT